VTFSLNRIGAMHLSLSLQGVESREKRADLTIIKGFSDIVNEERIEN
jgi:hypothetical protein